MTLGVIGTGRLGLSFALLCAQKGFAVCASDKNADYISNLQNKVHKTSEPFIEEYLQSNKSVQFTTSNRLVAENSDIIFLFVPTPSLPTGEYDQQYIEEAIESMKDMDLSNKILVIGCTTMPGYTQGLIDRTGYDIVYNPEFIAQGDIVNGLRTADMILIGTNNEHSIHALTGLYRALMNQYNIKVNAMSPTAAEITKISINCFLTMKIAYANMIGEIAINTGIENEVNTILTAIGSDSRIGNKFLGYGYGYSGVCLPRDNRALAVYAEDLGIRPRIPLAVDNANAAHATYLREYFIAQNPDKNIPFIFTQLAYKKGVDILTESAPYQLCKDLLEQGYKVVVHESPAVVEQVRVELKDYIYMITFNQGTPGCKITL